MKMRGNQRILKTKNVLLSSIIAGIFLSIALFFFPYSTIFSLNILTEESAVGGRVVEPYEKCSLLEDQAKNKDHDRNESFAGINGMTGSVSPSINPSVFNLVGTAIGQKGEEYAIFTDQKGGQSLFRVGDRIFGIGVLTKIEKDKAVMTLDSGRLTVFPREEQKLSPDPLLTTPNSGQRDEMNETSSSPPDLYFQQKLDVLTSNLIVDATLMTNVVEGGIQGFILNDMKPDSHFRKLKLEEGDVVIRVNKEDISNITNSDGAYRAFAALISEGEGQVEIIRNGFRMTMNFHKQGPSQ